MQHQSEVLFVKTVMSELMFPQTMQYLRSNVEFISNKPQDSFAVAWSIVALYSND